MLQHTLASPVAPSRVVVLGGSGFIGSHLITGLANADVESLSISSKQIDLTGPDAVTALAAQVRREDTLVFISCLTPDKGGDVPTLMKNLRMAEQVGAFIEGHGCAHVIYLSSDAIYKDGQALVAEDSERDPAGLYGLAHVAREKMLEYSAAKAGTPLAMLRPCGVYGPGDTHNGYGPNRFVRTALTEGKISLFGNGEERRDHVFVEDVCRVMTACAMQKSTGTLNVATGRAHSFAEVADAVVRVVNKPVEIVPSPRKSPITHRHFDVTAAMKAFPACACVTLDEGLRRSVQALKAGAR